MSCRQVYLDYNATTPLEPEVLESIHSALQDAWGNPSSPHEAGKKAKTCIDEARRRVGEMIGADSKDIIFTSGGTEANNMVLQTAVEYFRQCSRRETTSDVTGVQGKQGVQSIPNIITSKIEHPAVNEYLEHLQKTGQADITYVPVCPSTGRVEAADIVSAIKANTVMVTVMLANNETGIVQNIREISKAVKESKHKTMTQHILVHTDAAQAIGKIIVDVTALGVDYLTIVGHKFYGPRIGAVYVRDLETGEIPLYPIFHGGGQERNYRPGTENTGMIAGLGKACQLVTEYLGWYVMNMGNCRDVLEERLQNVFEGRVHFNGRIPGTERLANTCNVSILGKGLTGSRILSKCKVLQASVGAACHSQNRVSPILTAIGIEDRIARNAIRLSIGRYTSLKDIDDVVNDLVGAVKELDNEEDS